jgi:hypothetical protein
VRLSSSWLLCGCVIAVGCKPAAPAIDPHATVRFVAPEEGEVAPAWKARTKPVASMYLDFTEWLPIHEAYEAEKPAYFAQREERLDLRLGEPPTQHRSREATEQ